MGGGSGESAPAPTGPRRGGVGASVGVVVTVAAAVRVVFADGTG